MRLKPDDEIRHKRINDEASACEQRGLKKVEAIESAGKRRALPARSED
jgi:hypothetical protein